MFCQCFSYFCVTLASPNLLTLGKTQINLVFLSLNRNFVAHYGNKQLYQTVPRHHEGEEGNVCARLRLFGADRYGKAHPGDVAQCHRGGRGYPLAS